MKLIKLINIPIIFFLNYILAFIFQIINYLKFDNNDLMNIYYTIFFIYSLTILYIIKKDKKIINVINILLLITIAIKSYCIINEVAIDMYQPFVINLRVVE